MLGGHEGGLDFIQKHREEFRLGPMKRLQVSGAFHTPLMKSAAEEFRLHLNRTKFAEPLIAVHSNLDSKQYPKLPKEIRDRLYRQIYRPVRWEQTLHTLYDRDVGEQFPSTYEVGPGSQLRTMLKQTNAMAGERAKSVEV